MQSYLKDILANPPYRLGSISNLLLIVSAVLTASVFLVQVEEKDITLNLARQQIEVIAPGEVQLSMDDFEVLYPKVKVGQTVSRGDTLFVGLNAAQVDRLQTIRSKLAEGKLIPTAAMLDDELIDLTLKNKMIALAKAQARNKAVVKRTGKKLDAARLKQVKNWVKDYKKEISELHAVIPKFRAIEKDREQKFSDFKVNRYEKDVSLLPELRNLRQKWTESQLDTKQREGMLKTAQLKLREYESELEYFRKNAPKDLSSQKQDLTIYEADIAQSLDSLWNRNVVISEISGKIASIRELNNVVALDTLVSLEGVNEGANRSNVIFAIAKAKDGEKIYPGANLLILRQDGSQINGEVVRNDKNHDSADYKVEIASAEELSFLEIEQIILPSKNEQFIEKVLENF